MSAQTAINIERAERRAQAERPASIIIGSVTAPCVPGNHNFWEALREGGGGTNTFNNQHIRVLRCDLPKGFTISRGQKVTLRNDDPYSPDKGTTIELVVGQHNSLQAALLAFNIESLTP